MRYYIQPVNPRGTVIFYSSFYHEKKINLFFIRNFISVYIIFYVKLYQCNLYFIIIVRLFLPIYIILSVSYMSMF